MHTNLCYRIGVISVADGSAITAGSSIASTDAIAAITDARTADSTAGAHASATAQ